MDSTIPDDDFSLLSIIFIFGGLLCLPLLIVLAISTSIAYSRTRDWQKTKAQNSRLPATETEALVKSGNGNDSENDSELDPEDSDDEAELKLREEKRRDLHLTTREYFWKEMGKTWKGDPSVKNVQKAKERADRKKLAKAVARELVRLENKKNMKVGYGEKLA